MGAARLRLGLGLAYMLRLVDFCEKRPCKPLPNYTLGARFAWLRLGLGLAYPTLQHFRPDWHAIGLLCTIIQYLFIKFVNLRSSSVRYLEMFRDTGRVHLVVKLWDSQRMCTPEALPHSA